MAYAPYVTASLDFVREYKGEFALGASLLAGGASGYFQQRGIALSGAASMYAARYNAALAIAEGNRKSMLIRRTARLRNSADFAQMSGKSGVLAEEGGWLEVLAANYGASEADATRVIESAHQTAFLEIERGKQAKRQAKYARRASIIRGVTRAAGTIAGLGVGARAGSSLIAGPSTPSTGGSYTNYGGYA